MHGSSPSLATLEASLTAYIPGPMYFDLNYTRGLPKLIDNPHSWTKVCNIIFLDSPAGTGFSYSNTTADYVYGGFKIVSDAYAFLIKWFEAYPEFLSNPLYIGGDSYSGLIVPMLTQKIADGIEAGAKPLLNIKVPFGHGMALISDEIYEFYINKIQQQSRLAMLNEARRKVWSTRFTIQDGFHRIPLHFGYEDKPCPSLDKYYLLDIWAKNPFVRKIIHALQENITGVWKRCTPRFKYKHDVTSVIIYHKNLTKRGYRALIYSGYHDLVIPYVGTEAWVRSLGYSIVEEWRSWFVDGEVAGYTRAYDHNLTFATVKGV
ncbi:serine carboxypeptidase 1-like [Cryptomeria japonica]|uniref:serine carboxypeptidase 1-like n=1 Tax=Cryptomeria japonica TaxID=3369 RepID=UPI0027DAAC17|nr:serine carboxypeptidase 1-like [Cryptomeria japonica]